eukprot:TRINITY_DN15579_c0_g1_i5.p1 TRINITY_DN15579_c0_g1~~TRINITY_DN15579_c0_g1_i5.p1  ORF type:complete len:100 (-),score=0.24 TRINITY_DN15579_c0_g1_i5:13-312(-)
MQTFLLLRAALQLAEVAHLYSRYIRAKSTLCLFILLYFVCEISFIFLLSSLSFSYISMCTVQYRLMHITCQWMGCTHTYTNIYIYIYICLLYTSDAADE